MATAKICRFFNKLFNSVNALNEDKVYELRRPVTAKSKHHKFWDEALSFLKNISFVEKDSGNPSKEIPTFKYWIRTIEAFKLLWKKVSDAGFIELKTRYMNQDPLEIFFGQIRSQTVTNRNPTPVQFESFFKSLFFGKTSQS